MSVSEIKYIDRCKELMEEKLNWCICRDWKQRDYEYLSELIFESTGILLSISTLKRIWKTNYDGTPHPSTLNALVQFLGYKDWLAFKRDQSQSFFVNGHDISDKKSVSKLQIVNRSFLFNSIRQHKRVFGVVSCFLGMVLLLLLFFSWMHLPENYEKVTFSSRKVLSDGLPNTVVFDYDVSQVKSNNVEIQQNWDSRRRTRINKDKHQFTSVYYYPGYHRAVLAIDGSVIKEHSVHVTTDGWMSLVRYNLGDLVPIYIPGDEIRNQDRLYVSPLTLTKHKVDITGNKFFVSFYNVMDFGSIKGNDFILESEVKDNLDEGGLTGQYCEIIVMCKNGRMIIPLSHSGCVGNIRLIFMDTKLYGREHDLSAFGCDMSVWNRLRCEVKDQNVQIFLNENKIYTLSFTVPADEIIGLHYMFFGCGSVNHVQLSSLDNHVVYEDDFYG